jgi:hypothetical protein
VDSSSDVDNVVVVRVSLQSDQALADASTGWSLVVAGDTAARAPVSVPADAGPACAGMAVPAGQPVDCVLAFPAGNGERYVALAVGPVQRQWKL